MYVLQNSMTLREFPITRKRHTEVLGEDEEVVGPVGESGEVVGDLEGLLVGTSVTGEDVGEEEGDLLGLVEG